MRKDEVGMTKEEARRMRKEGEGGRGRRKEEEEDEEVNDEKKLG